MISNHDKKQEINHVHKTANRMRNSIYKLAITLKFVPKIHIEEHPIQT